MKWFKHHSDTHKNLKAGLVIAEKGMQGYGFWWLCVELIASQGEQYTLGADKNWKRWLIRESGLEKEEVDDLLEFFGQERLIDAAALKEAQLSIPNLSEYCDDYESRRERRSTNSVRTKSEKVALEEKRKEKNREEKITASMKFLSEIPETDLKELVEKYEASPTQIKRKADELRNYCLSKGKTYKNYRAFLENALQKDFGRRLQASPVEKVEKRPLTADERAALERVSQEVKAIGKGMRVD